MLLNILSKGGRTMNNFLNKLERKWGRYAVPNLIMYLLGGYAVGFVLFYLAPDVLNLLALEPYYILHGQILRLVTWLIMPPDVNLLFAVIVMMLYYQLGLSLEKTWGAFRFNIYIFGGIIFTVLGAFILYGVSYALYGMPMVGMGAFFTTNYINMGIFLAFAVCFPEMQVFIYFIIPVKMKWMAAIYGVWIVFSLVQSNWAGRVAIVMSLLNFLLFYASTRNYRRISPFEIRRRQAFKSQVRRSRPNAGVTKHKCAICGRTEEDDPTLEFRFCSKCEGNYEYCQDHLFTHQHIHRS